MSTALEKPIRSGLYYVIPASIMDSDELIPSEKLLYCLLSGLADQDGKCFPSDDYLAKRMHEPIRTLQKRIASLEKAGLISRQTVPCSSNPFKKIRFITVQKEFKKCLRNAAGGGLGNAPSGVLDTSPTAVIVSEANIVSEEIVTQPPACATSAPKEPTLENKVCEYLRKKIKEQNPNFSKSVSTKWEKDAHKLIKIKKPEELRKMIDWIFIEPFWSGVVLSPAGLLKNMDKIEMQMIKKPDPKSSRIGHYDENGRLMNILKERFGSHPRIEFFLEGIGFNHGANNYKNVMVKDYAFREQVLKHLKHLELSTEGL